MLIASGETWDKLRGRFCTCGVNILCPSTFNMIKPLDCCFKSICIDFVFGHYVSRLDPKMGWITDNIILKKLNFTGKSVIRSILPVYHLRLAQYQRLAHLVGLKNLDVCQSRPFSFGTHIGSPFSRRLKRI